MISYCPLCSNKLVNSFKITLCKFCLDDSPWSQDHPSKVEVFDGNHYSIIQKFPHFYLEIASDAVETEIAYRPVEDFFQYNLILRQDTAVPFDNIKNDEFLMSCLTSEEFITFLICFK